ncbi:MAG: CZB domain-containing protein [Thiomonas sp.]
MEQGRDLPTQRWARRLRDLLRRLPGWRRTPPGSAERGMGAKAQQPPAVSAATPQTAAAAQAGSREIAGLDFEAAIDDHLQWTARLRRYGHGDRHDPLDPEQVCRTDACSLGRWLERQTPPTAECAAQLALIEQEHADFHHKAAVVVTLVQTGAPESALQSVEYGDFAQRSRSLIQHLLALRQRFAQSCYRPQGDAGERVAAGNARD